MAYLLRASRARRNATSRPGMSAHPKSPFVRCEPWAGGDDGTVSKAVRHTRARAIRKYLREVVRFPRRMELERPCQHSAEARLFSI